MTDPTRAVVEASVDVIAVIDERGLIESINPAVERMFGYAADELIGRNISMLMPEPYRGEHDGYLRRYRETGERRIIGIGREVSARRKDGSTFPVHVAVSEIHEGGRRRFAGILRDISDVKEAERRVREQEAFVTAVLNTVAALVMVLDRDGRVVRFNRACEEASGYAPDDDLMLERLVPPEELDDVNAVFDALLRTKRPNNNENHWVRRDGKRRKYSSAASASSEM